LILSADPNLNVGARLARVYDRREHRDGYLEFGIAMMMQLPGRPLIQNLDSISISLNKAKHDLQL